jgi:uncharacterized protein YoxC
MAGTRRTDLFGRLADLSEEAMQRLSEAPGADKLLGAVNTLKERTDDLQKRVRGLEELEKRLAAVEAKVEKLSKGATSARSSSTRKSTKTASTKTASTKSSGGAASKKS